VGWYNTSAATGGTNISAMPGIVTNGQTFWARWTSVPTHTVTFNGNGGVPGTTVRNVNSGTIFHDMRTLPAVANPTTSAGGQRSLVLGTGNDNHAWFDAQSGGSRVPHTTAITANRTVWARWQGNITFNANGGTHAGGNLTTRNIPTGTVGTYAAAFTAIGTPSREGFIFAGWENNSGTLYSNTTFVTGSSAYTLRARWTAAPTAAAAVSRTGTRSQQALGTGTGFNSWFNQNVDLVAGTTYTFSAYVNTSAVTDFATPTAGVVLQVVDGAAVRATSLPVNTTTNAHVNGGWQRVSVTFRAERTGSHHLRSVYRDFVGTAWADDFQLEIAPLGTGPSNANLLQNGNFEYYNTGHDTNDQSNGIWTLHSQGGIVADQERMSGEQALRLAGRPADRMFAFQDVPINLLGSQTYVLSGWAKAHSVPTSGEDVNVRTGADGPSFGMMARITYANGATEYHHLRFNSDIQAGDGIVGWQFASAPIVPQQTGLVVQTIRVYIHYNFNANVVWFDNISLVREMAQTFTYNNDGNLVQIDATGVDNTMMRFFDRPGDNPNHRHLVRELVTPGNGTFNFTYDTRQNLTQVENSTLRTNLAYDTSGNNTSSTMSSTLGGPRLVTTVQYFDDRNRVERVTDANGVTHRFGYAQTHDVMRGRPNYIIDPRLTDGRETQVVNYFDRYTGRPTQTFRAGVAAVNYTYTRGDLAQIHRVGFLPDGTRMTQDYHFTYNAFGQMTDIRVGTRQLKSYMYNNVNHMLERRTYENNHNVTYTYDNLGRVQTVTHRNTVNGAIQAVFTYTYTGDGQVHSIHDSSTNRITEFNYDSLGRLVSFAERNQNGSIRQTGHHRYDHAGRLYHFAYDIPSLPRSGMRRYQSEFHPTTGNLTYYWLASNDSWRLRYNYDNLHRLQTRQLQGIGTWETRFAYHANRSNASYSSLQVHWMTHAISGHPDLRYEYLYDANGNISRWNDPVSGAWHTYTYDVQNQLTRETIIGGGHNRSFEYTFDTFGNIRNRVHLQGNTVTRSTTFAYNDPQWRDLLTAVNGNVITYDQSGNPTRWHDGTTFTWARGRQLTRAVRPNGTVVEMTYGHDGIRSGKTVTQNGVTTEHTFYTNGGRIVAEIRARVNADGSRTILERLEFIYDESGRPVQLIRNGNIYNYVLNLQGDVQQIRRSTDGVVVATYLYNAWGELISSSGLNNMHNVNPLRYRGYFYDSALGMYYLQTRYYCPFIGRFINADEYVSTGQEFLGFNMFAYCLNNPVNMIDPDGRLPVFGLGGSASGAGTSEMSRIQPTTPVWPPPQVRPQIITRAEWGATPVWNDRWRMNLGSPTHITIHHTGSDTFRMYDGRSYGSPYHFIISPEGGIFEGRPLGVLGAHLLNHNTGNIGIAFTGNFEVAGSMPDQRAIASAESLISFLRGRYPTVHVLAHSDWGGRHAHNGDFASNQAMLDWISGR